MNTDEKQIIANYEKWLYHQDLSDNTVTAYVYVAKYYLIHYSSITKPKIKQYKNYLIKNYRPETVNARIYAINKFLEYNNKKNFMMKTIHVQRRYYLDNVISNTELTKFQKKLLENGKTKYYMLVRTLVCTAARISETLKFQVEDVKIGYAEMLSKGGKIRRIYFPAHLKKELLLWLDSEGRSSGTLFLNKNNVTLSVRGVESMLRSYAKQYGINPDVVHPHSYRHRYAINFLKRRPKEIIALADILGHSSIDTTRIYTRLTANEQYALINSTVNW